MVLAKIKLVNHYLTARMYVYFRRTILILVFSVAFFLLLGFFFANKVHADSPSGVLLGALNAVEDEEFGDRIYVRGWACPSNGVSCTGTLNVSILLGHAEATAYEIAVIPATQYDIQLRAPKYGSGNPINHVFERSIKHKLSQRASAYGSNMKIFVRAWVNNRNNWVSVNKNVPANVQAELINTTPTNGAVDTATCDMFAGWVTNTITYGSFSAHTYPFQIKYYINGPNTAMIYGSAATSLPAGSLFTTGQTGAKRYDLAGGGVIYGQPDTYNRGFETEPPSYLPTGVQLWVYAVDIDGAEILLRVARDQSWVNQYGTYRATNTFVDCYGANRPEPPTMQGEGAFDTINGNVNHNCRMVGWAWVAGSGPVTVRFYVGNTRFAGGNDTIIPPVIANISRPDLINQSWRGYPNYPSRGNPALVGFDFLLPALAVNSYLGQPVYAYFDLGSSGTVYPLRLSQIANGAAGKVSRAKDNPVYITCNAPPAPTLSANISCLPPAGTSTNAITINYSNNIYPPITAIGADTPNINLSNGYWVKFAGGSTTVAPDGFGGYSGAASMVVYPATTYVFWVSNGLLDSSANPVYISIPQCSAPSCTTVSLQSSVTTSTSGTFFAYANGVATGVTAVSFPVWSNTNGQNDIVWYVGSNLGGGQWRASINLASHVGGNGNGGIGVGAVTVHAYMDQSGFPSTFCGQNIFNVNQRPIGNFETLNCTAAIGWSFDFDDTNNLNQYVKLEVDGSSVGYIDVQTTTLRTDINNTYTYISPLYTTDGNHGFSISIPTSLKDGIQHSVRVLGKDTLDGYYQPLTPTRQITCNPQGWIGVSSAQAYSNSRFSGTVPNNVNNKPGDFANTSTNCYLTGISCFSNSSVLSGITANPAGAGGPFFETSDVNNITGITNYGNMIINYIDQKSSLDFSAEILSKIPNTLKKTPNITTFPDCTGTIVDFCKINTTDIRITLSALNDKPGTNSGLQDGVLYYMAFSTPGAVNIIYDLNDSTNVTKNGVILYFTNATSINVTRPSNSNTNSVKSSIMIVSDSSINIESNLNQGTLRTDTSVINQFNLGLVSSQNINFTCTAYSALSQSNQDINGCKTELLGFVFTKTKVQMSFRNTDVANAPTLKLTYSARYVTDYKNVFSLSNFTSQVVGFNF